MISSNKKLLRCPRCNGKPHLWKSGNSCGYVICMICNLSTRRYNDFIESWQEQAINAWNEMAKEQESEDKECVIKKYIGKIHH